MSFSVFTMDGRASEFDGVDVAVFITQWKTSMIEIESQWPFAYMSNEGVRHAVHFNPLTITAVSTPVHPPHVS